MVILPGKHYQECWFEFTSIKDHTIVGVSNSEFSNDELVLKWLKHFDKHSASERLDRSVANATDGWSWIPLYL